MRHAVLSCSVMLIVGTIAHGQRPVARFDNGISARNIPLDIENNLILMKVRVNGSRPLTMLFDSAASITGFHPTIVKELGLTLGTTVEGSGTGGKFQATFAGRVKLGVEGADVTDQIVISMPYEPPAGFEFDGILGYDFIKAFVVEIDYQKKTMNLYEPRRYVYRGKGRVVPIEIAGRRTPLVNASMKFLGARLFTARLEIDTGADGAFLLNSPVVRKHRLLETQKQTVESGSRGAGGEQRSVLGRADLVTFAAHTFRKVPVALSLDTDGAGASEEIHGLIGGEVLRRYRVIFDYSRSRVILEPNASLNDPFDVEA